MYKLLLQESSKRVSSGSNDPVFSGSGRETKHGSLLKGDWERTNLGFFFL